MSLQYHYNSEPMSAQVQVLIRLVLNTIQAQSHKCRSLPTGGLLQQQLYSMSKCWEELNYYLNSLTFAECLVVIEIDNCSNPELASSFPHAVLVLKQSFEKKELGLVG